MAVSLNEAHRQLSLSTIPFAVEKVCRKRTELRQRSLTRRLDGLTSARGLGRTPLRTDAEGVGILLLKEVRDFLETRRDVLVDAFRRDWSTQSPIRSTRACSSSGALITPVVLVWRAAPAENALAYGQQCIGMCPE